MASIENMTRLEELKQKCDASYAAYHADSRALENHINELKSKMWKYEVWYTWLKNEKYNDPIITDDFITDVCYTEGGWGTVENVNFCVKSIFKLLELLNELGVTFKQSELGYPDGCWALSSELSYIIGYLEDIKADQRLVDLIESNDPANIVLAVELHQNTKCVDLEALKPYMWDYDDDEVSISVLTNTEFDDHIPTEHLIIEEMHQGNYSSCEFFTKSIFKLFEILDSLEVTFERSALMHPKNLQGLSVEIQYIIDNLESIKENSKLVSLIESNDPSNVVLAVELHKSQSQS